MKLDLAGDPSGESVLQLSGEELEALTHPYPVGSTRYHAGMFALSAVTAASMAAAVVVVLMAGGQWWSPLTAAAAGALHFQLARKERRRWKVARIRAGAQLPDVPARFFEQLRQDRQRFEARRRHQRRQHRRQLAGRLLPRRDS